MCRDSFILLRHDSFQRDMTRFTCDMTHFTRDMTHEGVSERWGAGVEYHFHERWGAGVEYHFQKNLMSPTPRRKWYLTTGRRAH